MKMLALAASFLVVATGASAQQQKPNFSGTWVVISPAAHAGQEETIAHTATVLQLGHASEGGGHSIAYKLDGSETRDVMSSDGQEIVTLAKVTWEGDTLVIQQSTQYPDGRKLQGRLTFALNADGHLVRGMTGAMDGQELPAIVVVAKKK